MHQFASKGHYFGRETDAVRRNCRWSLLFCLGLGRIGTFRSASHELSVADFAFQSRPASEISASLRARSSIGQSTRLRIWGLGVQIPPGAPNNSIAYTRPIWSSSQLFPLLFPLFSFPLCRGCFFRDDRRIVQLINSLSVSSRY